MPYIMENPTKTISNLPQLEEHTKSRFPTKLSLVNKFSERKLEGKLFQELTMLKQAIRLRVKNA